MASLCHTSPSVDDMNANAKGGRDNSRWHARLAQLSYLTQHVLGDVFCFKVGRYADIRPSSPSFYVSDGVVRHSVQPRYTGLCLAKIDPPVNVNDLQFVKPLPLSGEWGFPLDMRPGFSGPDRGNEISGHGIIRGDFVDTVVGGKSFDYLNSVPLFEDRERVVLTIGSAAPAPGDLVRHILRIISKVKMFRITTPPVVTGMKHVQAALNRTIKMFVTDPMSPVPFFLKKNMTVSAGSCSNPVPTAIFHDYVGTNRTPRRTKFFPMVGVAFARMTSTHGSPF